MAENTFSKISIDEVYQELVAHLTARIPYAVTRCGDGDTIILNGMKDPKRCTRQLKTRIGYVPDVEGVCTIQTHLMEAFKDSDVIGVSPYCLENKEALPEHLYWKITLDILQQHISPNSTKLCHMNVHLRFLRDKYYDRLLRGQKKLYYVSCRNLDEPLKRVFGISEVHSFIVAPQMNNDPSYVGIRHFPEQFVQVKSWIENLDCTGSLCLVGAGYVGKIYNIWFKRRGGVALDVGSIFDQWAGRRTRGKNCNKAYCYDDTYKL